MLIVIPFLAKFKVMKIQDLSRYCMFHVQFDQVQSSKCLQDIYIPLKTRHNYNTRLASKSTFALSKSRAFGPKIGVFAIGCFKRELKAHLSKCSSNNNCSRTSFEKNCFSAWASTLNMGLINKVDMVCLSPVGYGV